MLAHRMLEAAAHRRSSSGTLWTPSLLTTLAWFDADDASTLTVSGSSISQWNDKSGNGYNATQTTGSAQPQLASSSFGSLPAVNFATASQFLYVPSIPQVSGQTVFAVLDTTSLGTGYVLLMERNAASASNMAIYLGGTSTYGAADYTPWIYWNAAGYGVLTANRKKSLLSFNYSTSGGAATVNNTQDGALTPITSTGSASALTTWRSINGAAGVQSSTFKIAEVIVLNSISSTDKQKMEGYLAWKWGINGNLPAGHPYKSAPPYL